MKNQTMNTPWNYQANSGTVRDSRNHCLFSSATFANGGTFDAANLKHAGEILQLAAASPDLLKLAEATIQRLERHAPGTANGTLDVIRGAIAKSKGRL